MKTNDLNKHLTADALAGYCMESTLWKILFQMADFMLESQPMAINPDDILIERDRFVIKDNALPASEPDAVWKLAASICYISSGHIVFGQNGKEYQKSHPNVKLPVLQKEHSALTPLIHKCLDADETKRISLQQLSQLAKTGLDDALKRERIRQPASDDDTLNHNENNSDYDSAWPEEMIG